MGLSIAFGDIAVLFEEAYEDSYGRPVQRRSTELMLTVSAYGGNKGCVLNVESRNMECLLPSMPTPLPSHIVIGANETYSFSMIYNGVKASDSEGNILILGTLKENGTGRRFLRSTRATSVQVETVTRTSTPAYRHRKELGIAEFVDIKTRPENVSGLLMSDSGNHLVDVAGIYQAGFADGSSVLSVSCGHAVHDIEFSFAEPPHIFADRVYGGVNGAATNTSAGNFFACIELFVAPTNVSFAKANCNPSGTGNPPFFPFDAEKKNAIMIPERFIAAVLK